MFIPMVVQSRKSTLHVSPWLVKVGKGLLPVIRWWSKHKGYSNTITYIRQLQGKRWWIAAPASLREASNSANNTWYRVCCCRVGCASTLLALAKNIGAIPLEQYATTYCTGSQYGKLISNILDASNALVNDEREHSVLSMIHCIWVKEQGSRARQEENVLHIHAS
jgi:hypothetical protein